MACFCADVPLGTYSLSPCMASPLSWLMMLVRCFCVYISGDVTMQSQLPLWSLWFNALMRTGNYYSATSNNMKLVQWPLVGGLLHLVQRGGKWLAGCGLGISWRCLMLIKLEWLGYRIMMLSSFHLIPERHGVWTDRQTDGRTDGQTDRFAVSISRVSVLTADAR